MAIFNSKLLVYQRVTWAAANCRSAPDLRALEFPHHSCDVDLAVLRRPWPANGHGSRDRKQNEAKCLGI
jgi:hypothetical protein